MEMILQLSRASWVYMTEIDGTDCASTAHVARILDAPVILVVDVKGMSRSVLRAYQGI